MKISFSLKFKNKSREKGVSLIEFLIFCAGVAVISLAIFSTCINIEKSILRSAEVAQGSNIASSILADYIKTTPFQSLIDVPDTSYQDNLSVHQSFTYNIKIYEIVSNKMKLATIKLWWQASSASIGQGRNRIEVSTIVSNNED